MKLFIIAILFIIVHASFLKEGDKKEFNVSYQIFAIAFISIYFFAYCIPRAVPHADFSDMTLVETSSGDYTLKVDFKKEFIDDVDDNGNNQGYVEYRPATIYWPNGGYTILDPNSETDKMGGYVCISAENDSDDEYKITIPKRNFTYYEKMANISVFDWILMAVAWIIGVGSIIVYYCKKDNNNNDSKGI